jgi:uncharacterized protein (UPF0335 family)
MPASSALKISAGTTPENFAKERLKALIERVERLEEEKSELASDVRDVYAEAKSAGFEPKVMRQIIRLRKMDSEARMEQEELLDLYKTTLGMM